MKAIFLAGAVITIAGGLGLSSSAAYALPQFTLAPSALGGGAAGTGNVVADNMLLSVFSTTTFTPTGSNTSAFTQSGTWAVTGFQSGNSPVAGTGLNTTFGLYFSYTAVGNQTSFTPGLSNGAYTSLEFSLSGYAIPPSTPPVSYTPNNATPGGVVAPQVLAQGQLTNGTLTLVNGVPSSLAEVSFNTVLAPFFLAPTPFYNMAFSALTNTTSRISTAPDGTITVIQGGGAANFGSVVDVPEPASAVLLGAGLIGAGLIRRRRAG